jgi:hypothetical protein
MKQAADKLKMHHVTLSRVCAKHGLGQAVGNSKIFIDDDLKKIVEILSTETTKGKARKSERTQHIQNLEIKNSLKEVTGTLTKLEYMGKKEAKQLLDEIKTLVLQVAQLTGEIKQLRERPSIGNAIIKKANN